MGKISTQVSKGLGDAIAEAKAKMSGNVETNINDPNDIENSSVQEVEALLNSGTEAQKKRKRRTKAEMEAARQEEESSVVETTSLSYEEFCELELKKAAEKGYEDPEFDFRNFYEKGQTIYYVHVLPDYGEKEIIITKLRTIYPRMMVGATEACCQCIGYNDRNQVFLKKKDADTYYASLKLTPKYVFNESKSRRKKGKGTDDTPEEENLLNDENTEEYDEQEA